MNCACGWQQSCSAWALQWTVESRAHHIFTRNIVDPYAGESQIRRRRHRIERRFALARSPMSLSHGRCFVRLLGKPRAAATNRIVSRCRPLSVSRRTTLEHKELLDNGDASVDDPVDASDLHPLCKSLCIWDSGVDLDKFWKGRNFWSVPRPAHPLSTLLQNISLPKWLEDFEYDLRDVRLASTSDGSSLGTIGALDLEALRALAAPSPFGRGTETIYDEMVRKGLEVTASQMHIVKEATWSDEKIEDDTPNRFGDDPFVAVARTVQRRVFPGRPIKLGR